MKSRKYDVIIIGAGPAGLTASIFASRYGLKNIIIEKSVVGGQVNLTDKIENYPGFKDGITGVNLTKKIEKHAKKYDINFFNKEVEEINKKDSNFLIKFSDSENVKALSVIIATGAHPRRLSIPGEEKFTGRGVSYCATCDGPLFKDKHVVVIGGGNTAVEEALYLSDIADSVRLIHRRDRLRAVEEYQKKIENADNIQVVYNSVAEEVMGDKMVRGLKVKNLKEENVKEIECDGVFIFIGYIPNSNPFKNIVELDSKNYILTDEKMQTSCEGIFAAGDVRSKSLRQVVTACSDGAVASDSVFKYIRKLKGESYKDWENRK